MRYLLTLAIFLLPALAFAARFDFTNGQPAIMDDGTAGDTFEQTRYDFTNGQPTPVFDTTAVDESVVAEVSRDLIINNGKIKINNGKIIIK